MSTVRKDREEEEQRDGVITSTLVAPNAVIARWLPLRCPVRPRPGDRQEEVVPAELPTYLFIYFGFMKR